MSTTPIREIELHAREYLSELIDGVIHERMEGDPLAIIAQRIRDNIRAAENERSRIDPLIARYAAVRDMIVTKTGDGENFVGDTIQKKIEQMRMNQLQLQLQAAKMQVALEILSRHAYKRPGPTLTAPEKFLRLR